MEEFGNDYHLMADLRPLETLLQGINSNISDTVLLAGSETLVAALMYYASVREAARRGLSNAKPIYEEQKQRFPGVTTEPGFTRFFCACLTQAGIKHELGLSSSRFSHELDDSLELWNQLDIYVIYLPKEKQYMSPTGINLRYPFIPIGIGNTKGVFCKTTTRQHDDRAARHPLHPRPAL